MMEKISIQGLKRSLRALLRKAIGGVSIIVASYNNSEAAHWGPDPPYLHRGARFGVGKLRGLFGSKTQGRYLDALRDGRRA